VFVVEGNFSIKFKPTHFIRTISSAFFLIVLNFIPGYLFGYIYFEHVSYV
jgi:hypothetical protein